MNVFLSFLMIWKGEIKAFPNHKKPKKNIHKRKSYGTKREDSPRPGSRLLLELSWPSLASDGAKLRGSV